MDDFEKRLEKIGNFFRKNASTKPVLKDRPSKGFARRIFDLNYQINAGVNVEFSTRIRDRFQRRLDKAA